MDPQLAKLLQLTSLYGTLAMYYEHIDPEKHIYFYKKHFEVESQLVQYYWSLQRAPETQSWGENYTG
ncbi:hypothetical protein [Sporolactobacillus inulinus]|uniref:Uncharacterized protein n=1 Tax=Sporolactobacillus inulinus CASD TaxID=1069536 RepID=A0A0U1QRR2_9BACL|nr:hypothetical protein [Sporolactobacillus inulinus]KLI03336.1 hypothetical protein SINU_03520 [Sporolactobacillus inulinus CASD]GEB78387.1 hypothetical protein SIN01_27320 [Sporolactobacillus inulinus]